MSPGTLSNYTDDEEGAAMLHVERSMAHVCTTLYQSDTGCSSDSTQR